jgi:hypothetical protein
LSVLLLQPLRVIATASHAPKFLRLSAAAFLASLTLRARSALSACLSISRLTFIPALYSFYASFFPAFSSKGSSFSVLSFKSFSLALLAFPLAAASISMAAYPSFNLLASGGVMSTTKSFSASTSTSSACVADTRPERSLDVALSRSELQLRRCLTRRPLVDGLMASVVSSSERTEKISCPETCPRGLVGETE